MSYKIPSKWTKEDFVFATWCATVEIGAVNYDIIRDLQDCLSLGFSIARSFGFRVDYSKYAYAVDERNK